MDELIRVLALYLMFGAVVLFIFDRITKRIRKGIKGASAETSIKLATGAKTSFLVFVLIMWATWPVVLYGALESRIKNRNKYEK